MGMMANPRRRIERMVADGPAAQKLRVDIFKQMDYNGNNVLSLAEIDSFVQDVWPELSDPHTLMRAYKACDRDGSGLVGRNEFRLLLKYLLYFDELRDLFVKIDTSGDGRLTVKEFTKGADLVGGFEDAEKAFKSIDQNDGGFVLFDEFCVAAARMHAVDDKIDDTTFEDVFNSTKNVIAEADTTGTNGLTWYQGRANLVALSKKTPDAKQKRQELFARLDVDGDKNLTLPEVLKAVRQLWPEFDNEDACRAAFQAADRTGDGSIQPSEVRLLMKYLVFMDDMWDQFKLMDVDGNGTLSFKEFAKGIRLSGIKEVSNPQTVFKLMDSDESGSISLNEFMVWLAKKKTSQEEASDFERAARTSAPSGSRIADAALSEVLARLDISAMADDLAQRGVTSTAGLGKYITDSITDAPAGSA